MRCTQSTKSRKNSLLCPLRPLCPWHLHQICTTDLNFLLCQRVFLFQGYSALLSIVFLVLAPRLHHLLLFSKVTLLAISNSILDTTLLSDSAFDLFGLEFGDVLFASELGNYDHLPMVVDFEIKP